MYIVWFSEWLFTTLAKPFVFLAGVTELSFDILESVLNVFGVLPYWLYLPFNALISIAILFRVSQFIPTIGGAS